MGDQQGEKTEEPTERRRREARERGQVAKSADVIAACVLGAAAAVLAAGGLPMAGRLAGLTAASLRTVRPTLTAADAAALADGAAGVLAESVLPWLLLCAGAAAVGHFAQFGLLFSPQALTPKWSRVNPASGVTRLFSPRAAARLGGGLAKLTVIAGTAAAVTWLALPNLLALTAAEPAVMFGLLHHTLYTLGFWLAGTVAAVAAVDFLFQKWQHARELRMTKQEVRDELKNQEGDGQIKGRRREAHRKLTQARDLSIVATADVVLTNPTHYSVALKYEPESMDAPVVVAKGADGLAFRIRELARGHAVPVLERPALARRLYRDVKVGRAVPEDLYGALIEVLALVYRLTGRTPPSV